MIGVGLSIPQIAGSSTAFSPLTLFAAGEQGVWYDPSDFSTMFQDSAGTTPVTAVEQPVGLILDKSKSLALGSELVTNGTFDTDVSGWSGGTATWSAGTLRGVGGGVGSGFYSSGFAVTAGNTYKFTFTIKGDASYAALQFGMRRISATGVFISNTITPSVTTSYTTITAYIVPTSTVADAMFFCRFAGTEAINIDNVSVKEIAGNHASQATTTSRPTLSAKVNLLLNSRLNGGVSGSPGTVPTSWANISVGTPSFTYAADSEATGNSVRVVTDTTQRAILRQNVAVAANTVYCASMVVDTVSVSALYQYITWSSPPAGATITFSLNGSVVAGATSVPAGRHTLAAIITVAATAGSPELRIGGGIQGAGIVYDITIRQVQVQSGSVRTAYQWANTATDYDTAGFPYYLAFDGVDDSLSTASINFTSTDKMSVFAGVRRLRETSTEVIVELSSASATNNGAFGVIVDASASNRTSFNLRGNFGLAAMIDTSSQAAPATDVFSVSYNIAESTRELEIKPRVNASIPTLVGGGAANAGSGNFGSYPLFLGRQNNTSFPANIYLYSLIVRGAQSTDAQIAAAEAWTNIRAGAY